MGSRISKRKKNIWKKEFETDTGSSCLISVKKLKNKTKQRKRGRKKTNKKGGRTNRWSNGMADFALEPYKYKSPLPPAHKSVYLFAL